MSRAQSGVRLGKAGHAAIASGSNPDRPFDILFKTRLATSKGFSKPLPMGLMAEARGSAPSLDDALQHFSRAAQSLCPVLVFIGNCPIEDIEVRPWDWTTWRRPLWYGDRIGLTTANGWYSTSPGCEPCVIGDERRSRCAIQHMPIRRDLLAGSTSCRENTRRA